MLDKLVIGWKKGLGRLPLLVLHFKVIFKVKSMKKWVKSKIKQKFMIPFTTFKYF